MYMCIYLNLSIDCNGTGCLFFPFFPGIDMGCYYFFNDIGIFFFFFFFIKLVDIAWRFVVGGF